MAFFGTPRGWVLASAGGIVALDPQNFTDCRHKNFSSIDWLTPLCKVKTNWNQIIILEYNESPFDHIAAAVIYFTGVKPDLSSV